MRYGLLLFFILSFQAKATDCSAIDLRNDHLGAVRDQENQAWCYAYTVSDLYTYKLGTEKLSSADVAITYNKTPIPNIQRKIYEAVFKLKSPGQVQYEHVTGFMAIAAKAAMHRGVCLESNFPSGYLTKVTESASGIKEELVRMKEATHEIHEIRLAVKNAILKNQPYNSSVYYKFPGVDKVTFFATLAAKRKDEIFYAFTERACQSKRIAVNDQIKVNYFVKNKHIFNIIDEQLEKHNIVGFDYDSGILENLDLKKPKIDNLHASSIVGRRFNANKNSCEYLVRNSHGESCAQYDPRVECDHGNLWMPKETLQKFMYDMVYLE